MFGGSNYALKVLNNAKVTFGTLLNSERKSTSNGVSFIVENWYYWNISEGSILNLYGCSVISDYNLEIDMYGEGKIYNSMFTDGYYMLSWFEPANYDVYNVYTSNDEDCPITFSSSMSYEGLRIFDSPYLIWLYQDYPCNITNFYGRGATEKTFYIAKISTIEQAVFYLLNGDLDVWSFEFWYADVKVYRQYTFDLTIFFENGTEIQNANITIRNDYLGTSSSWLTFTNGSIPQQVYSMGHYNQTGGDTIYNYNPYNITVTYPGYETYRGMINITDKLSLEICLCPTKASYGLGLGSGFILALILSLAVLVSIVAIQRKRS